MTRLSLDEVNTKLKQIKGWDLIEEKEIKKTFTFKSFLQSIEFVNKVAKVAEKINHHPNILIQYNMVTLTLSTHDEGGLTEKDFILARNINLLP